MTEENFTLDIEKIKKTSLKFKELFKRFKRFKRIEAEILILDDIIS